MKCHHCMLYGIDTQATTWGVWVDPEGSEDGERKALCRCCVESGTPSGPGYREIPRGDWEWDPTR